MLETGITLDHSTINRWVMHYSSQLEQDHRLIERITKPMSDFKNFICAHHTLAGIELIRMLRKGQMRYQTGMTKTPVELFYDLAG